MMEESRKGKKFIGKVGVKLISRDKKFFFKGTRRKVMEYKGILRNINKRITTELRNRNKK